MTIIDCWPTVERFAVEVEALTEDAFRAVHGPARLDRGSERDLLTGPALTLIVGPPGSGKSHLLRWLEIELRSPKRDVFRIPEGVSIDGILGRRVAPATPAFTPVTKEEVRDRLVAALLQEQQKAQERVAAAKQAGATPDPLDRDAAGWLAKGLADLLSDPITAKQFLTDGKGAIARLAADPDARFSETDFLRPDDIRFLEASRPAQMMLTKLGLASTSQFRVAAANLMNRVVEAPTPAAAPPAPARETILLIDDVRSADALADLSRRVSESPASRAVVTAEDDELIPAGVETYRILALGPADGDYILDLVGARLDAARGAHEMATAEVESYGRAPAGHALFPFRRNELVASIFAGGETRTTAGAVLERVKSRLATGREAVAAPPAPLTEAEEARRADLLARADEVRAWLGGVTAGEAADALQETFATATALGLLDQLPTEVESLRQAPIDVLLSQVEELRQHAPAVRNALASIDDARVESVRGLLGSLTAALDAIDRAAAEKIPTSRDAPLALALSLDGVEASLRVLGGEAA